MVAHESTGLAQVHSERPRSGDRGEGAAEAPSRRGLLARLLRPLVVVACCIGVLQVLMEMVAWRNRARMVAGKSEAEKREAILGDLAPFLQEVAREVPETDSVLLVTNELPWRARYLLLPRPVYTYDGPLPEPKTPAREVQRRILTEAEALLDKRGISWVVYYRRTTSGQYRITDSLVFHLPQATGAGED